MSILAISLAIIVALALPWWLGGVVRLLVNDDLQTLEEKNIATNYAINFAYGVLVMAYLFTFLMVLPEDLGFIALSNFGLLVTAVALLLTALLGLTKVKILKVIYKQLMNNDLTSLFTVLVVLFSVYAVFSHPYVFDSAQLQSVIKYVNPLNEFLARDRGMIGYSATVLSVASFFTDYPLPFIASSLKVPLGIIFFASLTLFARYFRHLNYYYALCVLSVAFLLSTLGLYGFVTLGKDSIIGIAFMWLFFALWLTQSSSENSKVTDLDLVVVLLAAATIGIITIPYVFAFFVILALSSIFNHSLWKFTALFLAIGAFPLASVLSNIVQVEMWKLMLAIWAASLIITILRHSYLEGKEVKKGLNNWFISFIPTILLISLILIFPLSGNTLDAGFNYQWSSLKPPLDDKTDFLSGLLYSRHTESVMSKYLFYFGWAGVLIWALFDKSPVARAIASMPFVILLFSALHAELDWHIIRYRLLWDLYKDIPQWLSGLYVGLGLLAVTTLLLKIFPREKVLYAIFLITVVMVSIFPLDRANWFPLKSYLLPIATFNNIAGHKDGLMAKIIKFNFESPDSKFILFQRGIFPGPVSFSQSFGYASYFFQRDKNILLKKVAPKEEGLICYHKKKRQDVIEFMSQSVFSIRQANIIKAGRYSCDQLVRN